MSSYRVRLMRIVLALCLMTSASAWSQTYVNLSITTAPPPLPVYVQPPIPDNGYIWQPGYWAYEDGDYYWVPGTWVLPPSVGLFWTPGYWSWRNGIYIFFPGYWGPQVGFYGGINYGYGYTGSGYHGGYWRHNVFYYNRSINNFGNRHITHVYNKTVINNVTVNRISYNGGRGGVGVRPSERERNYARQKHIAPTQAQLQHAREAFGNHEQRASFNRGKPPIAATDRPGQFRGNGIVSSRDAGGVHDRSRNEMRHGDSGRSDNRAGDPHRLSSTGSQSGFARDNSQRQIDRTQQQQRDQLQRQQREQQWQQQRQQQHEQQMRSAQQRQGEEQRERQAQQQREQWNRDQREQQMRQNQQQQRQQQQRQREQSMQRERQQEQMYRSQQREQQVRQAQQQQPRMEQARQQGQHRGPQGGSREDNRRD